MDISNNEVDQPKTVKSFFQPGPGPILNFQGSVRHVQKGHPTFVTQVADSPKLMRI